MQLLNQIISEINNGIFDFFADCEGAYAYDKRYEVLGIAVQTIKQSDTKPDIIFPTIMDYNGEGLHMTFTDVEAMRLYHRILDMKVVQGDIQGYGDNKYKTKVIWMITMPVYYNRSVLKIDPHQLALHLIAKIPSIVKIAGIDTINIFATNVILNPLQVFRQEYPTGVDYFVKTEHSLLAVNYTIESIFKQNCFNDCPEEV